MQQMVFSVIYVVFSCSLVIVQSSGRCTNTTIDIDISFSGSSNDKGVACDNLCQFTVKKNGTGLYCYHKTKIICPEVTVNGNEAVSCISSSMCRCNIIRCDVCSLTTVLRSTSLPRKSTSENVSTTKKILSIVVGKRTTTVPGRNTNIPNNKHSDATRLLTQTKALASKDPHESTTKTSFTITETVSSNDTNTTPSRTTLLHLQTIPMNISTELYHAIPNTTDTTSRAHYEYTKTIAATSRSTQLPNTSAVSISRTTQLTNTSTVSANKATHLPNTSTVSINRTTHLPNTSTVSINRTTHLPNTSTVSISRTTQLPNTSTYSTNKTTQLPNTSAVLISRTPQLPITSTVLASTSHLSTNTINIPITETPETTSTNGQQRAQYTSEHIQKVESTTAEQKPMCTLVLISLVLISIILY